MTQLHTRSPRLCDALASGEAKFRVMAGFIVLVFCLGGGSRHDILSLAVLRPLAFGFVLYALLVLRTGDLRAVRVPLALLLALAAWLMVQLVPLPPALWQALPGRELFVEIHAAAEVDGAWLPLTMSPSRTLNSLMALAVPLAALLLFAVQEPARRASILPVLWAIALASAVLGVAQLAGPGDGPLYLYRITNNGLPVGLFANRNHQALMVCIAILLSGHLVAAAIARGGSVRAQALAACAAVLVLLPFLLIAGSRAGLLIGLAMIPAAAWLVQLGQTARERRVQKRGGNRGNLLLALAIGGLLALLLGVFIAQSRVLALDRLLATSGEFELRAQVWPTLAEMLQTHWLLGTGFGSFELAFKQVEPFELLRPAYLNHAHNDLAQWVIEGGTPALAILLAFAVWLVRRLAMLGGTVRNGGRPEVLLSAAVIAACAAASLVDYPLRVPSLMAVFALACGFIAAAVPEPRRAPNPSAEHEPAFRPAFPRI